MEIQADSLMTNNQKEWKSIEIQGAQCIISTSAMENSWKISVSNLIEIWTEIITKEAALKRCQSLNLLLDLDSFDIEGTLDDIFNDIPKHATEKSFDQIKLETCIEGVGFKFNINLTKGTPHEFWNEITEPMCQSSMELQRRHKIILDLLKQKEEELLEYKLSGARLTRKNIGTSLYNEQISENKISIHDVRSEDCVTAFQSMINLYNEMEEYESSLPSNSAKHLPQRSRTEMSEPRMNSRKQKSKSTSIEGSSEPVQSSSGIKHENPDDEPKKKRSRFTFDEKKKILEESKVQTTEYICDKYKIHHQTLIKWKAKREQIYEAALNSSTVTKKKMINISEELDNALHSWLLNSVSSGTPVTGPMIQRKALILNAQLGGNPDFKASHGWLDKWKQRKMLPTK